jgi:hypothetical protein
MDLKETLLQPEEKHQENGSKCSEMVGRIFSLSCLCVTALLCCFDIFVILFDLPVPLDFVFHIFKTVLHILLFFAFVIQHHNMYERGDDDDSDKKEEEEFGSIL